MSRLRSDDKLRGDIFELVHARDQRATVGSRSDHVTAILAAVDRHLTQAGPVTRYQCPPNCLQGLPIHSEGCPNRPSTQPQAGHRGTPGDGKRCVISDECINEKDCYATGRCLRVVPLPPGSAVAGAHRWTGTLDEAVALVLFRAGGWMTGDRASIALAFLIDTAAAPAAPPDSADQ